MSEDRVKESEGPAKAHIGSTGNMLSIAGVHVSCPAYFWAEEIPHLIELRDKINAALASHGWAGPEEAKRLRDEWETMAKVEISHAEAYAKMKGAISSLEKDAERLAGAARACIEDLEPIGIKGSTALHMAREALELHDSLFLSKRPKPFMACELCHGKGKIEIERKGEEMKTHMADESAPKGLVPLCGAKDWEGMTAQWEFVDCKKCLKIKKALSGGKGWIHSGECPMSGLIQRANTLG